MVSSYISSDSRFIRKANLSVDYVASLSVSIVDTSSKGLVNLALDKLILIRSYSCIYSNLSLQIRKFLSDRVISISLRLVEIKGILLLLSIQNNAK
nr:MAG TPA: hypothetical protein [Caudoviricetes sp.]